MNPVKLGNRRLLKLADVLDTADAEHRKNGEPTYDQRFYVHQCGTPACAFGHAKAAFPKLRAVCHMEGNVAAAKQFFSLDDSEWAGLFGCSGCDDARTAKQAAKYIRKFVKNRQ